MVDSPVPFRLTAEDLAIIDALGSYLGLNRTAVLRFAVREAAHARGLMPAAKPMTATPKPGVQQIRAVKKGAAKR